MNFIYTEIEEFFIEVGDELDDVWVIACEAV
jgi:hypothetical protein